MRLFVTGGARSGKSAFALKKAEAVEGSRYFIATAEPHDDEMQQRIAKHQEERGAGWKTIEEPLNLASLICSMDRPDVVLLVDCLGLWSSNLLFPANSTGAGVDLHSFEKRAKYLAEVVKKFTGSIVLVSNEVGLGIVPADANTRLYRDALGKVNQQVAAACDSAAFISCGYPLWLKGGA